MSKAIEYRGLAAKFPREAQSAELPHVRQLNLSASAKWDSLLTRRKELSRRATAPARFGSTSNHWFCAAAPRKRSRPGPEVILSNSSRPERRGSRKRTKYSPVSGHCVGVRSKRTP
jgi:hypothetical protein